jgi:hypothetical protein
MLAGPYCTWLLGSLGAEVTKVEMPGSGDFARRIAPFAGGESVYFMSVNRQQTEHYAQSQAGSRTGGSGAVCTARRRHGREQPAGGDA